MSEASRKLQPGAEVVVDWNLNGKLTQHKIVDRRDSVLSQSGVLFRVDPPVHKYLREDENWIDADWFEEVSHAKA